MYMSLKNITFDEFISKLQKDAEKYFECDCISEKHDGEEIFLEMSNDLSDFNEETTCDNFDNGYEQWHINNIYINGNDVIFSYIKI